jgi:hypothetical protein
MSLQLMKVRRITTASAKSYNKRSVLVVSETIRMNLCVKVHLNDHILHYSPLGINIQDLSILPLLEALLKFLFLSLQTTANSNAVTCC